MQTLAWSLIVTYMEFPLQENTQHRLSFMDHWQTDCYAIENLSTVPLSAAMLQIHLINQSVLADFIYSDWILSLNYVVLKQKLYCYVSQDKCTYVTKARELSVTSYSYMKAWCWKFPIKRLFCFCQILNGIFSFPSHFVKWGIIS